MKGVRSQESGVRSQESGVRRKKEEGRRKEEGGRRKEEGGSWVIVIFIPCSLFPIPCSPICDTIVSLPIS
ncbi:hypothetical protein [Dolichospermum sp. UHCC 0260]|uniref:hypothetical protein n=1 Tax=Dolichospermum sp. UHCC 0260 TaxID=2590025 RepID=UPI0016B45540|nr:hypothetical protein [Dolichospermum sp. UHCC 0260]MTJ34833.1 hypothetical protein [Dolichospermum sp. UHCC 0260]